MGTAIDFYFDLSSPYGYFASQKIDALAARHGRTVDWHPMLLGAAFKTTGMLPLTKVPLKSEYAKRDFARSARFHGLDEFRMPSRFPIPTLAPARIVEWLRMRDLSRAARMVRAFYHAYFHDDIDISNPDEAVAVAARQGVDPAAARAAIDDPEVKAALKREVEAALARGVFGSPFVIVDGEPFWGLDRFDQIEKWLAHGAF